MKFALIPLLSACAFCAMAAPPTSPPAAAAAASAASAPRIATPVLGGKERPTQSPAVRAAEGALEPGKLRPENPVVPQIAVPLRSATKPDPQAAADRVSRPPRIDDRAASCAAHKSLAERQKCMAE